MAPPDSQDEVPPGDPGGYRLRISPTTVDKLGVKLYDKVSAVVAELIANAYDADAEDVTVNVPLGTELARKDKKNKSKIIEATPPWEIDVIDDGHGMTPGEARRFFLEVGRDRRDDPKQGARSRDKKRPVMGRKGIGKLAPFGVCQVIEVLSSGGEKVADGYYTTHFILNYDDIMSAGSGGEDGGDSSVPLVAGDQDGTHRPHRGTVIKLSQFLAKRVPDKDTFQRQLEHRFALADNQLKVTVHDARGREKDFDVGVFDVPIEPSTRIDLKDRPVQLDDGVDLPVTGEVGMATVSYRNDEMAGVRIYARGKIVGTTRDFDQPAGFTGEFTARSYLVGYVHADWLDADDGEDLVRTDRQDILWSSEYGEALRAWGADLIKEVGRKSRQPRQKKARDEFLKKSDFEKRAKAQFADSVVVDTAVALAKQIGSFASEDELEDPAYVEQLVEVIMSVAPHRALMVAFQDFSSEITGGEVKLEGLADLFGKTHVAELASYSQIASERVRAIAELQDALSSVDAKTEDRLQEILAKAPYLIEPTWSVITKNQYLSTFKTMFETEWAQANSGEKVELTIEYAGKRPDFVLAYIGQKLHIVEIKAPTHKFGNADFDRMARYVRAFRAFQARHEELMKSFPDGWQIDLVADTVNITDADKAESFQRFVEQGEVRQVSWAVFLSRARTAHEEFLKVHDKAKLKAGK
jgi:DNA-binding transcriptional regulator YdaS (Cro superfamily)